MSSVQPHSPHEQFEGFLRAGFSGAWRWTLLEGACLTLLGAGCLFAVTAGGAPIGAILIGAGTVTLLLAWRAEQAAGFALSLLLALIALLAGFQLLWTEENLGAVLAAYFAARGLVTILLGAVHAHRGDHQWEALTVGGVTSLILAALILSGLPGPYTWMYGVVLGTGLVFDGGALVALSLAAAEPQRARVPAGALTARLAPEPAPRLRIPPRPRRAKRLPTPVAETPVQQPL
ncbi:MULTISPECIES: hypothetical protein [Rhodomicrobium]|uniref:hypothetical protein n=1 Tax=Rhodomicrobium TaxID=1068 RepID=UPI000B4B8266|nr:MULTISPECIES: hypothetical protein [Rhodomicrobium]